MTERYKVRYQYPVMKIVEVTVEAESLTEIQEEYRANGELKKEALIDPSSYVNHGEIKYERLDQFGIARLADGQLDYCWDNLAYWDCIETNIEE